MKKYSKILSLLLVLSILISPFAGTLNNIAVAEGEETPFIFDAETGTITGYKDGNPPADLVIPAEINGVEVKHIGDKAFYYSQYGGTIKTQLNSVELPEGLESLGYMAFQKNNFTEIKLPSTLTTLGQRSLAYNKLTTIEFPDNLKSIGKEAFEENEFTEIEIPSHIEEIGEGAFRTNKIEKVVLHDGLKTIGAKAFEDNLIEEIEIPDTVENLPSINKDNSIFRRNGNGTGTLYLAKVYNNSGATPKNTFGIVNPASVTIEYKDSNGEEIKPSKTIVGKELKIAKKEGSAWSSPIVVVEGSGEDLLTYNVDKDIGYKLIEVIDEISENYYQMNKEYTFEPEEIEEYTRPDEKIVTLNDRENIISFIYEKEGQEPTGPEADLRRAADMLKVTVQNTDIELTSPVTDNKWIKLVDYDKGGDHLISISWESSNEALIKIDEDIGYITLPEEGEEEVRLTATLSKSGHELKKHFDYVLTKNKPEETEDEKYIGNAIESLEWFRLNLNSDVDKNVNIHMEDALKKKGFEGIDVSIKSSDKPEYIGLDGNINYIFAEEYLKSGLPYNRQVALILEFSKGEAKKDFSIRTVVGWDRNKVRHAIEKNIIEPMGEDLVGANEGFHKIKEDFEVPTRKEYTTISWESSDNNILRVEPSSVPLSPSNIIVNRASVDKEVDLTCKIKFNHDDIELEKKYSLTVLALDNEDDIREEMQKLLDENYTVEKLKDFTNKKPINADDVRHDIQLIIPRNTGIKDYFNYEFKVTSDNEAVVINNNPISYRANVYRPLPEEEAVDVNLSVNMRHKEKDITVSKIIPIKVTALSQKEIDDEIQLMKLVKENYFQGIKGDNIKITEITKDLKPFREANLIDGELVWTRHINDDRNTGIYPDEIEGWENQEQWRLFKSSNPEVVTHENLLVIKPKHNTDVKIESTLSSKVYGKYAERYPDREEFQKLYRQDVSAIVTVIGEEDLLKPAKIELSFPGGKQVSPLYPGGKQIINAKVLNGLGEEIKGEKVIFESSNPNVLKHSFMDTFTAGEVEEETEVTITAKLESNPEIISSIKVIVTPKTEEAIPVNLDEEIDFLKQCYEAYMTEDSNGNTGSAGLSMLAPGAARLAGMDVENIQKHLYIDEDNKSAYQLSQSIITLIGADLDPRQYKDKSGVRNLVKELEESQQLVGENLGEFVKANSDKNSIEAQARSIIALDMAGGKYDEESAVSRLIEIYDKKDGSHTYKDIKTEGIVLVALSNHKDIDGVEAKVTEILNYLKTKQNQDGGFDIKSGFEKGTNSPTATGRVIQGLIANGINPLEDEEWIKNGSTMLNAIVRSKTVKENMKHSGYGKGEEDEYTYYEATYTAFGALMDLKNQKSMFELLKLEVDIDAEAHRVEIIKPDKNQIEVGQSLALTAKVYDKDGKVLQGQELIWESSDEGILTVKDGNIEAKSAGEATITVKVKGTEIQDTLEIIVINEVKTLEVNTAIIVIDKNDNYEIKSKPQKVTINKDEHDGGFTVFGALQATTSEYEGSGGWITSIYGIKNEGISGWMFNVNGKVSNVGANQVKLKEGDKVIWFYNPDGYKEVNPQWSELTGQEPEEELSIKIISNKQSIKVGEELPLTAEVRQGDKVLNDKEIMWLSSNAEIATIDENAKLTGHKAGEVTITAALAENKEIKDTIKISVVVKDKEDLTIEEVIKELRGYYSNKDEFTFRQAIGYNHTSNNLEKDLIEIGSKFKTNEDPKTASEHVGNIMGLIAAGKDPYNHNNKNYVETLVKAQNEEGKFIIGQYDDYPTTVAFSMLALDMADANYNRDKAIKALLGYQKDDGSFGGVDETGMVLTALGKYKDKSEVQTAINKGLKYLKEQQDENTGGFIVWGGENPYSASAVLQGLIAVGENPQSEKWTKGGKTIVDSLMNFYKDGHFEYTSEWGKDIDMPTEQAFAALADVYRGKSMFNEIKLNTNEVAKITIDVPEIDKIIEGEIVKLYVTGYDNENNIVPVKEIEWTSSDKDIAEVDKNGQVATKKPGKVTIIATVKGTNIKDSIDLEIHEKEFEIEYIGDTEVKNGEQVNAKVRLNNLTGGTKSATLIVGLYNKNTHKLLNYSIVKKELKGEEKLELAAGFLVPEIGEYYIRAFLWDDLEVQNIIMQEAKDIQVAN